MGIPIPRNMALIFKRVPNFLPTGLSPPAMPAPSVSVWQQAHHCAVDEVLDHARRLVHLVGGARDLAHALRGAAVVVHVAIIWNYNLD